MTTFELLNRLDRVRPRGAGRWSALCPAHDDRSPSLSVAQGDRGILLRCFAGCSAEAVCTALGLCLADLFDDAPLPCGARPGLKPLRSNRIALAFQFELAALDRRLRADRIVEVANGLDLSTLDDSELDRALGHIAHAHTDRERAEVFEQVADTLRARDYNERTNRERKTRAA